MLSLRYLPALVVLFGAALVPTFIHSYAGDAPADGRTTSAVPEALAGFTSVPSGRGAGWGERRFQSFDWMERGYTKDGESVRLTIVRSHDLKALYHHPELAVAYGGRFGGTFREREVRRFSMRPDVPVHVLHPAPGHSTLGLYVLEYGGEYVERPIWFHVRIAGELLFSRRRAMTLFFAHDLRPLAGTDIERLPSVTLLLEALDRFAGPEPGRTAGGP